MDWVSWWFNFSHFGSSDPLPRVTKALEVSHYQNIPGRAIWSPDHVGFHGAVHGPRKESLGTKGSVWPPRHTRTPVHPKGLPLPRKSEGMESRSQHKTLPSIRGNSQMLPPPGSLFPVSPHTLPTKSGWGPQGFHLVTRPHQGCQQSFLMWVMETTSAVNSLRVERVSFIK